MSLKILLVDDEEGLRRVLSISLADLGFEVSAAEDAGRALAMFHENRPDIVITDIKMPGMDGIDLLKKIKAENPDTEVIMITGHGDMDLAIKSLKYDATDFIPKPIADDALIAAIKRAGENIAFRSRMRHYTDSLAEMIRDQSERLKDAGDWAAVGQMVAGLSHTIKSIASGLKGGTYVLEKGLELDNKKYLEQGWEMVKGNVAKITQLSMDLLNYTRSGRIEPLRCDPNRPAREAFDLMNGLAEESDICLKLSLTGDLAEIDFDPAAIQRCLINLVTNAMDACRECGKARGSRNVFIKTEKREGWGVEYRVEDSCGGIPGPLQEKICHEYFSTKGAAGTGLGLMITRKIIDEHHGEIGFVSSPGEGTTFYIRLPETV